MKTRCRVLALAATVVSGLSAQEKTPSNTGKELSAIRAPEVASDGGEFRALPLPTLDPASTPKPVMTVAPTPPALADRWVVSTQSDTWLSDGLNLLSDEKDSEPSKYGSKPFQTPKIDPFWGQKGEKSSFLHPQPFDVKNGNFGPQKPLFAPEKAETARPTPPPNPYLSPEERAALGLEPAKS